MNILYILGDGSKWSDNELRYSLRSIDTFGANIGSVFLCGTHKPEFLNSAIRYVKFDGDYGCSARNITAEIDVAIEAFGDDLGDCFLLSSDDHFYTKKTDFDNYPYYQKGMLPRELSAGVYGDLNYTRCLVNTQKLLSEAGMPTANYAHHANTHIDVRIWRKCKPIFDAAERLPSYVEPNCVVLNALAMDVNFKPVPRRDIKIRSANDIVQTLKSECFSVYDSAIADGVGDWLRLAFPAKSRWER